ncbi:hypothetical protein [Salmonella enterica]|uniref:hypothetical protein n=1 Tax=Salmonella enterica TaxID=28901 RepID=UPI003D31B584
MNNETEMQTFPIIGMDVSMVKQYDALVITPHYLVSPMSHEILRDKSYVISKEIAVDLISMLQNGVNMLNSDNPSTLTKDQH